MVFMTCPGLATAFGFVSHQSSAGAAFDETVAGLDRLSFRLADIEELDDWVQRLQHWKVEYSHPADSTLRPGAKVLVFRDPDISSLSSMHFLPDPIAVVAALSLRSVARIVPGLRDIGGASPI
jgi:hypothetical protein